MRTANLTKELHLAIKVQASKEGLSIGAFILKIFYKYMSTLCLLLILGGCASTYTQVDKTNMDRFTHDQKISVDMT